MQKELYTERTHLFAPNISISIAVKLSGDPSFEALHKACLAAVKANEALGCLLKLEPDGRAFYKTAESLPDPFRILESSLSPDWKELAAKEAQKPFDLEHGEWIRVFAWKSGEQITLLTVAHHLAGDGRSIAHFVEEMLRALSGKPLENIPLRLVEKEELQTKCRLSPIIQFMVNSQNKKWDRIGKAFSFDEFRQMAEQYWKSRELIIWEAEIPRIRLDELSAEAKAHKITINTLITTALIKAAKEKCDIGLAASIRPDGYRGMANHATGISVQFRYNEQKSFWENAFHVHKQIQKKLLSDGKKYFLLRFMGALRPTLVDAAYFSAFGGYDNKNANAIRNLFGYNGNPKGISFTNLGRLPIEEQYGPYRAEQLFFAPPLVANAKRLFGAATIHGNLGLTFCVEKNPQYSQNKLFWEETLGILQKEL